MIRELTKKIKAAMIICGLFSSVFSQAQVGLDAEFRPRAEFRNGYKTLKTTTDDPAYFISQRTRLNFRFKKEAYTFKISAQDVRTWGEVGQLDDSPNTNIHEAWANINLGKGFQIKLGRQELIYDDQRLLGSVNWAQQGRSHDALLLKYRDTTSNFSIDLGGAYNQNEQKVLGNTYTLDNYKALSFLWLNKQFGNFGASLIVLADGFEIPDEAVNFRYTYGTHLDYNLDAWHFAGSFYAQNGNDAQRNDISAFMAAARATYDFGWLDLTLGYDHLSGGGQNDDNPGQNTFNTLYATNHKFYGHMDYFTNIPRDTQGGGLNDLYLKTGFELNKKIDFDLAYHHFSLANRLKDPMNSGKSIKKNLASELDISFSYAPMNDLSFRMGYSALFSDNPLEKLQMRKPDGLQQWAWAMVVLKPDIIN